MYIYTHVHIYIYMYVCMYVCMYVYIYIYIYGLKLSSAASYSSQGSCCISFRHSIHALPKPTRVTVRMPHGPHHPCTPGCHDGRHEVHEGNGQDQENLRTKRLVSPMGMDRALSKDASTSIRRIFLGHLCDGRRQALHTKTQNLAPCKGQQKSTNSG